MSKSDDTLEPTGPLLCRLDDLEATGAFGVSIDTAKGPVNIVLVRAPYEPGHIVAYHNACPHKLTPLEIEDHHFLDRDDPALLVCFTHGARFRVADGLCVSGPCRAASLRPIAVTLRKNEIFLTSADVSSIGGR